MASRKKNMTSAQVVQDRVVRMTPIAVAVSMVISGAPGVADAGTALRMAMPALRPGSISTNLNAPSQYALPNPVKDMTGGQIISENKEIGADGKAKGTTGVFDDKLHTLTLQQDTVKAIVYFNSFDIGSGAAVNVYMNSGDGSSALYRVTNSTSPSQLYGALNSFTKVSEGQYKTGGEIFLLNQNGILFGRGSQVNVGSMIGSALAVDEEDFKSGFKNSITGTNPTFFGGSTYTPETNFVKVDTGATITTSSGGRVFLLGGRVENAGTITTPSGQTVLAAGRDVYLSDPSQGTAKLYMSEANDKVPTVKGLLVEVNSDTSTRASEFATNSGSISTPTGNTTIVGWAVNQRGRISATTSVTQNGSVYLLARSGTVATDNGTNISKYAQSGGALTLDAGSSIEIQSDAALDATGHMTQVAAGSVFTPSRVELSGRTIEFKENASIVAPNATVSVRAAQIPAYGQTDLLESGRSSEPANSNARIVMGAGSVIDVKGTIDTEVSVARNFVTTDLLGYQDLKDAPLQKDGPIYRSKLTLDIRQSSPILGDLQSYRDAVKKSADEFMSAGGKVTLSAAGAVVMHPTSRIDVSGGSVKYDDAPVAVSVLVAEDGQRYTLNNAPADVKYVAIEGKESGTTTRFGTTKAASSNVVGKNEPGYVDGQAAGTLSVYAPVALLDGQLKGSTVVGERQKAGTDATAKLGTLNLGAASNSGTQIGSTSFVTAVVNDVRITASGSSQDAAFWSNSDDKGEAVDRELGTATSRVSAAQINASGFGNVNVTANHGIEQVAGANLNLVDQASVSLQTSAKPVDKSATSELTAGVVLGANTRSVGGSFKAAAYESAPPSDSQKRDLGAVTLKARSKVDMSGNWVNQRLDGNTVAAASKGGSITLQSDHALSLEDGGALNVSGGVTVNKSGAFVGTKAGSIVVEGLSRMVGDESVSIGKNVALEGYSLSQGGSVRIKTGDVTISDAYSGLSQGDVSKASLNVGSDFFSQGGFLSYDIDGRNKLLITSKTHIQPHAVVWQALASGRNAATGSDVKQYTQADLRAETVRKPVSLAFKSSGLGVGSLTMEKGAEIRPDALSSVSLISAQDLDVAGHVVTRGGQITAAIQVSTDTPATGSLKLESSAVLDVSGGSVMTPNGNGLLLGSMVNGGSINVGVKNDLESNNATLDIQSGAQLRADGGTTVLDVARTAGSFGAAYTRQVLASDGGSINIQAGAGGANLSGDMSARAGNATAQGGSLSMSLGTDVGFIKDMSGGALVGYKLHIQTNDGDGKVSANELTLSTKAVDVGGFNNLYVSSLEQIEFDGNVSLALHGHLRLDAPVLSTTGDNSRVFLRGDSTLQIGNSGVDTSALPKAQGGTTQLLATGGLVELFGQQVTQGIDRLGLVSKSELRLRGKKDDQTVAQTSGLDTQADVVINAPQVVPATATAYTLNAPGKTVTIVGGDINAQTPLSAGAALTINAATINQNGVVKAPFGSITLNATDSLNLGAGSLTSVSGEDLLVPYGTTTGGGKKWTYGSNADVTSFPDKAITLNAAGQSVNVQAGSKLNLSGGGNLVGWEFVPGPGGSKDIFVGSQNGAFAIVPTIKDYAPYDSAILSAGGISLNPSVGNALSLGNTVTFGAGGPIAAGTYAVLPARYALLPGAFLIKPATNAQGVGMGYSRANADGSYTVGAMAGVSGSATPSNVLPGAYTVMSSDVARRYSEITNTYADDFTAKQAAVAGTAAPLQAADAGRLSVLADKLQLDGQIQFAHAAGKRGGQLDIASNKIHVGTSADAQSDALNLTYDQLNKSGADSIMLGGVRKQSNADGSVDVTVASQLVQVDASGDQALSVGDLILASQDKVVLGDGAQIKATSSGSAGALLNVSGDGALLRVSSEATASSQRTAATGVAGQLLMGDNLTLQGGAITAEATLSTQIANGVASATSFKADKLVLGAGRVEVGGHDATATDSPLIVSGQLLNQVSQVKDLTLRSFSSVDMYGSTTLGGDKARNLTVDTANVRVMDSDAKVSLVAGGVSLLNTTQATPNEANLGSSSLLIQATGQNGGTGHVTLGKGQVAISGVQSTQVQAAGSVIMAGQGGLTVPGDLSIQAQSLTAQQAADGQLVAQGAFQLKGFDSASGVAKAHAGAGANLAISAQSVQQNGRIELPSGKLTITADQSVAFGATSNTDLSGLTKTIDGQAIATLGGDLSVTSKNADIHLAEGGVLNVSAGLGSSHAGSMTFSAVNGAVDLKGRLLATSVAGQQGGALKVDAQQAVDVAALANRIAAETSANVGNFARSIELRNRAGDQTIQAGSVLSSNNLTITADAGSLTVAGGLHANGDSGGSVALAAGSDVVIAAGADVQARALAAGGAGGTVEINSVAGQIQLQGGAIDTSGSGDGAKKGRLSLRALRTDTGVAVSPIATKLIGVDSVTVEAVHHYEQSTLTNSQLTQIKADNSAYLSAIVDGVSGSKTVYQNILDTLSGGQSDVLTKLRVRTGVEIDSAGDLTLSAETAVHKYVDPSDKSDSPRSLQYKYELGLDLTQRDDLNAPSNWTFRVAGDLSVQTSLGQGLSPVLPDFTSTQLSTLGLTKPKNQTYRPVRVAQQGATGGIRLIGGADMASANAMATVASADVGDVIIGDAAGVRTVSVGNTVGNISIAAGRDVTLLNSNATVYTTGRPLSIDEASGYSQQTGNTVKGLYIDASTSPFLVNGGNVSVSAQRDVTMNEDANQFVTDWWYRWKNTKASNQLSWFSRYDLFKQGIGTFGGGDISVLAGRDAVNVNAEAAASGYTLGGAATTFGGGNTSMVSGRDVVGGVVMGGDRVSVVAGRDIVRPAEVEPAITEEDKPASLQVVQGKGDTQILARNDLTVGRFLTAGQLSPSKQAALGTTIYNNYLYESPTNSSLTVSSSSGDLLIDGVNPSAFNANKLNLPQTVNQLPGQVTWSAAAGSVAVGTSAGSVSWLQGTDSQADLAILAQDSISLNSVLEQVNVDMLRSGVFGSVSTADSKLIYATGLLYLPRTGSASDRTPVRVVAEQGDVTYSKGLLLTQGLRMIAGQDIKAESTGSIYTAHQSQKELSLIQAGRDFSVSDEAVANGVYVDGPGDLVVATGRSVDLHTSTGLQSGGSLRNSALEKGSANITVLTGVNFAKGDVTDAVNAFYPLLGGRGVGADPALLYTQIKVQQAAASGQSTEKAAADAKALLANTLDLLELARGLAGESAYQQAAAGYVNHRADGSLTGSAAVKQLESMPTLDRNQVAGQLLAQVWTKVVPLDQRIQTAVNLSGGGDSDRVSGLLTFIQDRTGVRPANLADALKSFAQLPVEQQALRVSKVLSDEVSTVIADAASKSGTARDEAYVPAYQAISTVFPNATPLPATLDMGSSLIKTLQAGVGADGGLDKRNVRVFNPNGDINVGRLIASTDGSKLSQEEKDEAAKQAAALGIVTAGGGDVSILVRDNVAVNNSRIFTLVKGDEVIWSSLGNVDAGRGAKTVTATPAPVYYLDATGQIQVDVSSAISGSGISATGLARIAAPKGEINAGDAGISATGGLDLAANVIRGADAIVSPVVHGAPPPAQVNMALSTATPTQPTAAGPSDAAAQDDEAKKKKRKRSVLLDFLGFGSEDNR